jgi:Ca-activated chloride channel family protein
MGHPCFAGCFCLYAGAPKRFRLFARCAFPRRQDVATLHVDVKLVNVFVNVTDRNGAIVGGLTRDDFAVTEDGRPQQISVFERQSELPLNLTLAIDTSGSVQKGHGEEADAAHRFVHAILRPQDQMSLLQFATEVKELTPFTNKVAQIDRGLSQLHADYATALYDAILLGSEGSAKRWAQGAGAGLRRRRHGQEHHLCRRRWSRRCATR